MCGGKGEEVSQQSLAMLSEDGFGVELDAPHRMLPVTNGMNLGRIVRRGRGNLEAVGQRRALHHERVVAHDLERVWNAGEEVCPVVPDHRRLAVHYATRGTNHPATVRFANCLVPEADTQDRDLGAIQLDGRNTDACVTRGARAGTQDDCPRRTGRYLLHGDRVVAQYFRPLPELAQVLNEVVGERIVVVDDKHGIRHRGNIAIAGVSNRVDFCTVMPAPPPMPLVGRAAELATLSAALNSAARGRGGMHIVVGEGGIGKSRLALAASGLADGRGFTRVVGRAYPVETGIPYSLFADAFVPLLRGLPASVLQMLSRGGTAELGMLFPALRSDETQARVADVAELKPRLLDSFARLLQRLAARQPLLVVLENLHWADPSSLELLHFVSRGASEHPLLMLCTYNSEQIDAHARLRAMEQSLHSLGALSTHVLPPLSRAETSELICRQFEVPTDLVADFAALLHDRTRGNPFFIEETMKALVTSGRLKQEDGHWVGWSADQIEMPRTIRDALGARLDRLTAAGRRVATIAAVVGTHVPHALLEEMAGLDTHDLLEAIDELRRERMFVEMQADGQLAYEFTHPLLQEVLYAELGRARARALHGEIAEALEKLFGDRALAHADELAVHFLRAEQPAQAERACLYLGAAGHSALERGADREGAEALEAALAIAERTNDGAARERLLDLLARARQRLGAYASASDLWERAVTLAGARGDSRRVATLERRLGVAAFWSGRYEDALLHHERGLSAADAARDEGVTASLRLARSAVLLEVGRSDEAEDDMRAALAIAARIGEPRLLSRVHQNIQTLAVWRGPSEVAREHGIKALAFARAANNKAAEWAARWTMALSAGLTGDAAATGLHLPAAMAVADDLRSPLLRMWTAEIAIEYRSGIGEWDEAIALSDRTIADARAFGQRTLLPRLLVWSSLVHLGRGDFERAKAQIDEAWTLSGADRAMQGRPLNVHAVVPAHVGRASWYLARKQYARALKIGEEGLAIADRTGYVAWAIHRLMPLLVEASLWVEDWDRAQRYGDRLREMSQRLGHPLGIAWSDACFALMRMLQGDSAGAVAPLRRAAEELDAIPFVEHAARVRRQLAQALSNAGDTDGAIVELRRIHEVFARIGAGPALDDVREKLRELGARPPARTPAMGTGALTAREAEIARLVAARKSNKEIGAALDISSRTVSTHLTNIFTKFGVDSRGALTDLVRAGALEIGAGGRPAVES
jgi:DNA-binding CsgD family transcriptional regulator